MKIQQLQLQYPKWTPYTVWKYNNYNYNYKSNINKNIVIRMTHKEL
jgi:hypothetical protein